MMPARPGHSALESRKEHKPEDNGIDMAAVMGIEVLTEEQYQAVAETWKFRYENLELGENTLMSENSAAPSFVIGATTLFPVSQPCGILLYR
jgi:hypothetical protein